MPSHRPTRSTRHRRAGLALLAGVVLGGGWLDPATAAGPAPATAAPVPVTVPAEPVVAAATSGTAVVTGPVASVVAPPVAPPVAPVAASGDRWDVVGAAAMERLIGAGIDPAEVGYTVDFRPGRSGYRGLTFPSQQRIEMYVRADHDVDDVLRVLVHEVGHAVSETCLTGSDRAAYADVRGLGGAWYPLGHGGASGTEDHAEVFTWSVLGPLPDLKATGGGTPTADQLETLRRAGMLGTC